MNSGSGNSYRAENAASSWQAYQFEESSLNKTKSSELARLGKSGLSRKSDGYKSRVAQIEGDYNEGVDKIKSGRMFEELQNYYTSTKASGKVDQYRQNLRDSSEDGNIDFSAEDQGILQAEYETEIRGSKTFEDDVQNYYTELYGDTSKKKQMQFTEEGIREYKPTQGAEWMGA